jgi:acyl CoA:acetate/3-ketoacid CoA transferase alpha subunit/acyl CoA:acetate/3-ketoacid CoA transferase beta subunit
MSKHVPLATAVGRHVRPGMHLHFASTPSRSNASVREVARRFLDAKPEFTLSATGFHSTAHLLSLLRLGARYISCFFGDNYPTPRPNALYTALVEEGARLEHWSLWSYVTALRAGALGHAYATTNSLGGTTLGTELANAGKFFELPDPDRRGRKMGLVAAMRPDVAFIHAAAGDENGNFIASAPYGEGFWSAFAAKDGVIVTVERLVDADRLERCVEGIKVPAHRVLAVCEEPFGAHPQPAYVASREWEHALGSGEGVLGEYVDDTEHYELWRRMTEDEKLFADFKERVLLAKDGAAAYRAYVGESRLDDLAARARSFDRRDGRRGAPVPATSETTLRAAAPVGADARSSGGRDSDGPAGRSRVLHAVAALGKRGGPDVPENALGAAEWLVLSAARTIEHRVALRNYEFILAGIGVSFTAARVAKLLLQEKGRRVEIIVETGLVDLECGKSADPFLLAWANIAQARRLSSVEDVLGTLTCGAQNRCLGVLGAAEIDAHGDINSTRLESGDLLVGSGGANDIASSCSEVVAVVRFHSARLVPRVHYVTSPGRTVFQIATDRCVLSRARAGEAWAVSDVKPGAVTLDGALASFRAECRFPLLDWRNATFARPPSPLELEILTAVREPSASADVLQRRAGGA